MRLISVVLEKEKKIIRITMQYKGTAAKEQDTKLRFRAEKKEARVVAMMHISSNFLWKQDKTNIRLRTAGYWINAATVMQNGIS